MLKTFALGFVAAAAGVALKRYYDQGKLGKIGEEIRARGKKLVDDSQPIAERIASAARPRAGLKLAPSPSVSKRPPAAPWPADTRAMPK